MDKAYDVFGVGNAIVDILAFVPDEFISERQLAKGSMTLMDSQQQASIMHALDHENIHLASGGSAANTLVGIAQSGGSGVYCGKVAADPNGEFYRQDLQESGIVFPVAAAPEASLPTGTSVILTTPDAERTMCTHLGVSTSLTADDLDLDLLERCQFSYIEGYLWDAEQPRQACLTAMEQSNRRGARVAFTFSDPFLVDRFADEFREAVKEYCDILFCNAEEATMFCHVDSLDECAHVLGDLVEMVFITNSEHGCLLVENGAVTRVPGFPVNPLDTVGAGDAFAAGTLYGLTHGKSNEQAARWGNYIASKIVQINGPRLEPGALDQFESVLSE